MDHLEVMEVTLGLDSPGVRSPDLGTQFQPGLKLWALCILRHLPSILVGNDQECVRG